MQFADYFPLIISLAVGGLGAYYGAHTAFSVAIARLEERLSALSARVDSDHAKLDELTAFVNSKIKE